MKNFNKFFTALFLSLSITSPVFAEVGEDVVTFETKVHDFGDILIAEGAVSCTFKFKNVSKSPIVVHNVISSCGCTTPEWTKEPVKPGGEGFVKATYSNDQESTFDKTLTVYVSGVERPIVLRLRGTAHETKKDLEELYFIKTGSLGFRRDNFSIGYIDQGMAKEDNAQVANISNNPITVETIPLTEGLTVRISPNPVPARSVARVYYSVDLSGTSTNKWGRQDFDFKVKVNGKEYEQIFRIKALIKENFDNLPKEKLAEAPKAEIDKSYFEFGEIRKGTVKESSFTIRNKGKEPLKIYTVDAQTQATEILTTFPVTIAPGGKATLKVKYNSKKCSAVGEVVDVLSAITNSPSKPVLNLYVTGNVTE